MINTKNIKSFKLLCEKYSTWVIKYCSANFDKAIFMIWYRDNSENETEQILSYKSGAIFTSKTLIELREKLQSEKNELIKSENLNQWLKDTEELIMVESCTYDLAYVIKKLEENILDLKTIETCTNFINLFDDYINQDVKNNHLQKYIDNKIIKQVWEYYYEFIFWPRFNDKKQYQLQKPPKLEIDTDKLLSKLNNIILEFENNMNRKPFIDKV